MNRLTSTDPADTQVVAVRPAARVVIRPLTGREVPAALAIERACFGPAAWTRAEFCRLVAARNVAALVADVGGAAAGYAVLARLPDRLRVMNLAVAPDCRRAYVGAQLVAAAARRAGARRDLDLIVGDHNLGAHLFFKALGFEAVRTLRGFYPDGRDAYVFEHRAG